MTSENMLFIFSFPSFFELTRRKPAASLAAAFGLAVLAGGALAQTTTPATAVQPPTLRQALDAAWQLSSSARAEGNRRSELAAREKAASSWLAGEAVAVVAHRSDRLNTNAGFRENEAELELPLWNPGVRGATQRDVSAQRVGLDTQLALAKLKLAGELRELAANAASAKIELELTQRKLNDAQALASDIERRVKAGENARVDALQAQVGVQQAQAVSAQAQGQLSRLEAQWRAATGLTVVASADEKPATAAQTGIVHAPPLPVDHPALLQAQALVDSAKAKLALAQADKQSPMALIAGAARDRASFGAQGDTKLRIALRIPLGGDNRNAPRLAAARAELDAAQSDLDATLRHLPAELTAAAADLRAATLAQGAASQRATLSADVQALVAKSWRLGDSDLPARLRADNEKFEAALSLARSTLDVQRAIAKLNQAAGLLP